MKKFSLGIALGGGGARGLAHIGILETLAEGGVRVDAIAGTSMGAVIGAIYAESGNPRAVEKKLAAFIGSASVRNAAAYFSQKASARPFGKILSAAKQFFIMNRAVTGASILSAGQVSAIFDELHLPATFEELKLPFYSVATDIGMGIEKVFSEGDLRISVLASASIPGIFPPVGIDGSYYLDGGSVNSVPVSVLKRHCDFIIACDVRPARRITTHFDQGLAILSRSDAISSYSLSDLQIEQADFVIRPNTHHIHWADFKKMSHCIELGRQAALSCLGELKKAAATARICSVPKRVFAKNVRNDKA